MSLDSVLVLVYVTTPERRESIIICPGRVHRLRRRRRINEHNQNEPRIYFHISLSPPTPLSRLQRTRHNDQLPPPGPKPQEPHIIPHSFLLRPRLAPLLLDHNTAHHAAVDPLQRPRELLGRLHVLVHRGGILLARRVGAAREGAGRPDYRARVPRQNEQRVDGWLRGEPREERGELVFGLGALVGGREGGGRGRGRTMVVGSAVVVIAAGCRGELLRAWVDGGEERCVRGGELSERASGAVRRDER